MKNWDSEIKGTPDPIHEISARWRKVAHLLGALYKHEVPLHRVSRLGHRQWAVVAEAAGVNPPSQATIHLLCATLRRVESPHSP